MSLRYRQALSSVRRPHSSNIFFSKTTGPIKAKFYIKPQWGGGNESLFAASVSHDQDGRYAPAYMVNPLKIFFSGTKGPMALGLGMQHWGHGPNEI